VIPIVCPECGEPFEVDPQVLFLMNRFYCSLCDALLEVIEEEPIVIDIAVAGPRDDEADEEDADWADD